MDPPLAVEAGRGGVRARMVTEGSVAESAAGRIGSAGGRGHGPPPGRTCVGRRLTALRTALERTTRAKLQSAAGRPGHANSRTKINGSPLKWPSICRNSFMVTTSSTHKRFRYLVLVCERRRRSRSDVRLSTRRRRSSSAPPECRENGVSGPAVQLMLLGVRRPSKVTANAFSAASHRVTHRAVPRPEGFRERTAESIGLVTEAAGTTTVSATVRRNDLITRHAITEKGGPDGIPTTPTAPLTSACLTCGQSLSTWRCVRPRSHRRAATLAEPRQRQRSLLMQGWHNI
jgi:hypothetical protein